MSPFEVIDTISKSTDPDWEAVGDKSYNAFMVNRGLSYYLDCVMHANEMNIRYGLPKQMQFEYLTHAVYPKKKRFAAWSSSKKDKEVQMVSEYFEISLLKAGSVRSLLSAAELKQIEAKLYKGGTT